VGNASGAADFGSGNASAQTQRVVIASDQSAIPAAQSGAWDITNITGTVSLPTDAATETSLAGVLSNTAFLTVVDLMDTPLLDASSTNIPASASLPLEVVASLSSEAKKIKVNDTTGEYIGVFFGAATSEVLAGVIGPGMDNELSLIIPVSTRVSIRNMKNAAITLGNLCIQFLG
jgi:hypothetical protein